MSKEECIQQMSDYLFWDIDKSKLDIDQSYAYVIQRVLEYGQWNDWQALLSYYGLGKIVEACKNMRTLDPKALAYICLISDSDKKDFRCFNTIG